VKRLQEEEDDAEERKKTEKQRRKLFGQIILKKITDPKVLENGQEESVRFFSSRCRERKFG
jgi:hypothetical protein